MLEAMQTAFTGLMAWQHLGFMMLGIAVGLAVGILPGLGGIAGMSLLMPFIYGMSSWLYLTVAVVLSLCFCWYGFRLWRSYSDALARQTFRFSLIHLSLLFLALLLDHYLF